MPINGIEKKNCRMKSPSQSSMSNLIAILNHLADVKGHKTNPSTHPIHLSIHHFIHPPLHTSTTSSSHHFIHPASLVSSKRQVAPPITYLTTSNNYIHITILVTASQSIDGNRELYHNIKNAIN